LFRSSVRRGQLRHRQAGLPVEVLLKDEALLQEARRRGYDQDPAVRSVMNRTACCRTRSKLRPSPWTFPIPTLSGTTLDHGDEFSRPEQIRVLQVVNRDRQLQKGSLPRPGPPNENDIDGLSETWCSSTVKIGPRGHGRGCRVHRQEEHSLSRGGGQRGLCFARGCSTFRIPVESGARLSCAQARTKAAGFTPNAGGG